MSAGWPCPQCGASCKTVETLGIHQKRCRAMSLEKIALVYDKAYVDSTHGDDHVEAIKAVHAAMVAKLRGKK
jgi:hypothetical protein